MVRAKRSFTSEQRVGRRLFPFLLPAIIMIIVGFILTLSSHFLFMEAMKPRHQLPDMTPEEFELAVQETQDAMDLLRIVGTTGYILNLVAVIWIIVVVIYGIRFSRRDPEREPPLK